jgi:hypothetical protein
MSSAHGPGTLACDSLGWVALAMTRLVLYQFPRFRPRKVSVECVLFASFRSHRSRRTAVLWLLRFGSEHRPGSTVWLSGPMHVREYTSQYWPSLVADTFASRAAGVKLSGERRNSTTLPTANSREVLFRRTEHPGCAYDPGGLRETALLFPFGIDVHQYKRHQAPEISCRF